MLCDSSKVVEYETDFVQMCQQGGSCSSRGVNQLIAEAIVFAASVVSEDLM